MAQKKIARDGDVVTKRPFFGVTNGNVIATTTKTQINGKGIGREGDYVTGHWHRNVGGSFFWITNEFFPTASGKAIVEGKKVLVEGDTASYGCYLTGTDLSPDVTTE